MAAPLMRIAQRIIPNAAFVVADAIGLGFFSIAGVALALDAGMSPFVASVMGVVTGVFGGVLRDVLLNEVPMVLRDGRPYAIAAFLGCWLYILMVKTDVGSGRLVGRRRRHDRVPSGCVALQLVDQGRTRRPPPR